MVDWNCIYVYDSKYWTGFFFYVVLWNILIGFYHVKSLPVTFYSIMNCMTSLSSTYAKSFLLVRIEWNRLLFNNICVDVLIGISLLMEGNKLFGVVFVRLFQLLS